MAKKCIGCITWLDATRKPKSFKACTRKDARTEVMRRLNLPNFTTKTLHDHGVLHVYLDGVHVHPVDKATSKMKVVNSCSERGRAGLKRKRVKNGCHREGLRMLDQKTMS